MRTEAQLRASKKHYYAHHEELHDKRLAQGRKWRLSHPDQRRAAFKKWYDKNGKTPKRLKVICAWYDKHLPRRLWYAAKLRAQKKNLPFNITPEEIIIPEICPILGIALTPSHRVRLLGEKPEKSFGKHAASPSVDRIEPERGYVHGNIQVISSRANGLKNNGTLEEFEKIVAHLKVYRDRRTESAGHTTEERKETVYSMGE